MSETYHTNNTIAEPKLISFYQPIVNIKTNDAVGYEALARFQTLSSGLISPAEVFRVVDPLPASRAMILLAIKEKAKHAQEDWYISVNLPSLLFVSIETRNLVWNSLQLNKVNPSHLMVELTEETPWDIKKTSRGFQSMG